jgi:type II secretory pathway pseudopilin PulG
MIQKSRLRLRMNVGYETERECRGTTVVELVIAMAILVIVLGAIVPVFAGIRNGSDAQQARAEMLQNARVLNEHLLRHLAQAKGIVGVSSPLVAAGYIEFEAADGSVCRYAVNVDGYVEFGPVGAGAELAGPLDCLRFACYDANDLVTPIEAGNRIRFVTWEATLRSHGRLTRDRVVNGACCLRADGKLRLPREPDASRDVLSLDEHDAVEGGGLLP